ncbi:HAD-IB family phosphatase [Candidatus Berkelbacteria bacterium]|nr:HAD-IB family phosphatase [Candidatus Berkelbacteria bacterium]
MSEKTIFNIAFNCDSTLVSIEGPVELARRLKVQGIDELTEQAMQGEASFTEVFRRRFELLQPSLPDVQWLGSRYLETIVPGAREVIQTLKDQGHRIYLIAPGYRTAILKLAKYLGIPSLNVCAVDIEFDSVGKYLSFDEDNILTTDEGIPMVLAEIAKLGPTIYIGDSVRDLDTRSVVDLFIGFGGVRFRQKVADEAEVYVKTPNFLPVLAHIQNRIQIIHERRMNKAALAMV